MNLTLPQLKELLREVIREELKGLNGGQYYTVEEAAEKLKLHPQTVYELARKGKLNAEKKGKQWRVRI